MSDAFDIAVVGGGIVGLATAWALAARRPPLRLVILEKEARLASHQTGHNSGVIHSGIYYRPGSHKARLCVEGARLMKEFCAENGIRVEPIGKVIVATSASELPRLAALYERGTANGVPGLALIDGKRLREIEPHAAAVRAIHSPTTSIVDYGEVAQALARGLLAQGVVIRTGARVMAIESADDGFELATGSGPVRAHRLVNCAGLYSDVVARMTGARPGVRIVPFRGEYYMVRPERHELVRGLIYPVPDPRFPFLGVHFTRTVHGEVEAGPNAVLAFAREGYRLGRVHPRELAEHPRIPRLLGDGPAVLADGKLRDVPLAPQEGVRARPPAARAGDHGRRCRARRGGRPRPGRRPGRLARRRFPDRQVQGRDPRPERPVAGGHRILGHRPPRRRARGGGVRPPLTAPPGPVTGRARPARPRRSA